MAKLNANTVVLNPATGLAESLPAGATIPDWAASQVGDHLIAAAEKPAAKQADTSSKK